MLNMNQDTDSLLFSLEKPLWGECEVSTAELHRQPSVMSQSSCSGAGGHSAQGKFGVGFVSWSRGNFNVTFL